MPLVADESSLVVVNDEDANLSSSSGSAILTAADERRNSTSDDSGYSNKSSSPTDSVTHQTAGSVSGCSSMSEREISFEGYGESADHSVDNGITSNDPDSSSSLPPMIGGSGGNRATWMNGMLRNSLRRSDYNSPGKRGIAGATGAQQLYGGKAPASSRGSNGTVGDNEDFCSDASLEDDVVDLGHKVTILQQQISALADTQFSSDDRYSRSKQENAALTARLQMLEESLRDVELRAAQQLTEEQRRNKELIVRVEREKQLEIENCTIKLQAAEREIELTREDCARLRAQTERLRGERSALQQRLCEAETSLLEGQEELRRMSEVVKREREQWALESASGKQLAADLSSELDELRATALHHSGQLSPTAARVHELENEVKALKSQNNTLREANEELQAQLFSRGLEEGRTLLNEQLASNSLAAEFEVMSGDDVRKALREQQDVNAQLRTYIEGILLTIVENQPSLLERKPL